MTAADRSASILYRLADLVECGTRVAEERGEDPERLRELKLRAQRIREDADEISEKHPPAVLSRSQH